MLFGTLALATTVAVAQNVRVAPTRQSAARMYVQPAFVLLIQPAARATYHRVAPNLSGYAPGVTISAGGFVSRTVAIEGELAYTRSVSTPQSFSYTWHLDYVAQNQDLLLTELLRFRAGTRLELVGGGGYARTTARQISQVRTDTLFPRPPTTLPDESVGINSFTLTGGVDACVVASQHLVLIPTFRLRWVHRPAPASLGWTGAAPWSIQFGLGVRLR